MSETLSIGAPAPDFSLAATGGSAGQPQGPEPCTLSAFSGRIVILYFYPKDDTPGCTEEAIAFTGLADSFAALGAVVIGVSKDSIPSHERFRNKHGLGVILASDPEAETARSYGVWVEKSMYGKKYMGMDRATFLIDTQGVIQKIWRKVKVRGHADEVLAAARLLHA